ncbi:hypothetical protein LOK49_LG08G03241 [Camellia lanceoleosa]|uniref:Uncharacterized protein n=1 Tax=Camellia lanceoleosa TaxID=1840588 RepID=A0ACC0GWV3_9ERIC|nr:hypothetical protein LOK49_LG08G03241 [Camellia lanceoleosa]
MSNKSPIFPIPDPNNHFSDYGFDPQIDYFQVLEEAKKHKLETASRSVVDSPPHFKLQKPISRDDFDRTRKTKRRWWMTALRFFRPKQSTTHGDGVGAPRARPFWDPGRSRCTSPRAEVGRRRRAGPPVGRRRGRWPGR